MYYMNLRNGRRSALGSGSGDDEEEETDPKMIQESESIELVELLDVRVKKKRGGSPRAFFFSVFCFYGLACDGCISWLVSQTEWLKQWKCIVS